MLGIDVSSSSVKLVELSRNRAGDLVLERCAIEPLERGWITDGNIEKFDEVAEAVRRVVRKSGSKTRNVAMALPVVCPTGNSKRRWSLKPTSTFRFRWTKSVLTSV